METRETDRLSETSIAHSSGIEDGRSDTKYAERVQGLLDSMVRAMSEAIDRRTPYNVNHSRSMAHYGEKFLDWLETSGHPWAFDEQKRRAFLMSVWLHDVGKLTVPLKVMDKDTRLGSRLETIRARFHTMTLLNKIALLEGRITAEASGVRQDELQQGLALVEKVNSIGVLSSLLVAQVEDLAGRTYEELDGGIHLWLTPEERECLCVRSGTLTAEERRIMEGHVTATNAILEQVSFPEEYAQVPLWASAHHELLNGKGYPKRCAGEEISREVRLMTILDVFDALTAKDRPYKTPVSVEQALSVLHDMVEDGALDGDILALFECSRAWENE